MAYVFMIKFKGLTWGQPTMPLYLKQLKNKYYEQI